MGVGYQGLQLALLAKRRKTDFSRTLTLGRQNHYLNPQTLRDMFARFELPLSAEDEREILRTEYSEGLFRKLGAEIVDSMDASDYEGASIIHDLNHPIDPALVQKYTCVVDFGTVEHVFNIAVALKNATDLLAEGGTFLSATTANNFMGHGFYQFAPELFMRYLAANGFADIEVYLVPFREFPYLFRVNDPRDVRGRVELVNAEPVLMFVAAVKREHVPEMVTPIQSDYYDQLWHGRNTNRAITLPPAHPRLSALVGRLRQRGLRLLLNLPETISPDLVYGFHNSVHYSLVDPAKL